MTTVVTPIPARLKNVSHNDPYVAGVEDIIDDNKHKTQSEINTEYDNILSERVADKPATTGTTGDYPYNGMGRVELAKNMVNTGTDLAPVMVNQLTQDMFYKGAVGSRVPNTNTIFVIRYDYVLGENVTIPSGCVLQFEGGSIANASGNYTIDFNDCIIEANYKVFDSVLPLQDSKLWQEINPVWFGVVDDGVTDNIPALNYMLIFVSKLWFTGVTFRDYGNTMPKIVFHTTGPIRITEPLVITSDYHCHILGYPTFYYDGTRTEMSGAIILASGEGDFIYELNVTSRLGHVETVNTIDLSDGVQFGGICLRHLIGARLSFREICGFNSGIIFDGSNTASGLIINGFRVTYCINNILVNHIGDTWPNDIEVFGIDTLGWGRLCKLPSGFQRGTFLKIIGNATEHYINTWHIHDVRVEGRMTSTDVADVSYPIDFIRLEQDNKVIGFNIDNVRLEDAIGGGYFIWSKTPLQNSRVDSLAYNDKHDIYIQSYDVTLKIENLITQYFGVRGNIQLEAPYSRVLDYNTLFNDNILFGYHPFMNPQVTPYNNNGYWGVMLPLAPGQIISFENENVGQGLGTSNVFVTENDKTTTIAVPTSSLKAISGGYWSDGDIYRVSNSNTYIRGAFMNIGNTTLYVVILAMNKTFTAKIMSNMALNFQTNGVINKGATTDRPVNLGTTDAGKNTFIGFEYFNTTTNKPNFYAGSGSWVDAAGNAV